MENSDDCVFKSNTYEERSQMTGFKNNTYEKRSQMTEIMSRCGKMA